MTDESTNVMPDEPVEPAAAPEPPAAPAAPEPPAPPAPPAPEPPAAPAYAPPPAPPAPPAPQPGYQAPPQPGYQAPAPANDKQKVVAGVLAILLGSLGIHKFYLGYNKEGIILLAITIVGSIIAIGPAVASVIGVIEGIMYLTKSDEEFYATYVAGNKPWF